MLRVVVINGAVRHDGNDITDVCLTLRSGCRFEDELEGGEGGGVMA